MLTDKQTYLNGGSTEDTLEITEHTLAHTTPGSYQFITYCNHPDFFASDPTRTYLVWAEAILETETLE